MPTLPLYSQPTDPNAWHSVMSPGGGEWWQFDAEDQVHDRRVVIRFVWGLIEHPAYAAAYRRYRKNPTRHRPPLPGEFVGVEVKIFRAGRIHLSKCFKYLPQQFSSRDESVAVKIGPHSFESLADGSVRVQSSGADLVELDLLFRLRFSPPAGLPIVCGNQNWLIAHPLCDVQGRVVIDEESAEFKGMGFGDHLFATAPPANGVAVLSGRVLSSDFVCAFRAAHGTVDLIRYDAFSIQRSSIPLKETGEAYPSDLHFDSLQLRNPRPAGSALSRLHVKYDAFLKGEQIGAAWCEIYRQ